MQCGAQAWKRTAWRSDTRRSTAADTQLACLASEVVVRLAMRS